MRRPGPRPLAVALDRLGERLVPETTLARAQAAWTAAAGPVVAVEAQPLSEHAGVLTVTCRSAVWAQELELLAPDLLERLNAALARPGEPPPLCSLRVVAGGARTRSGGPVRGRRRASRRSGGRRA